ncbi:P-loop NTPase family protein [Halovulum sp. GXIMD14793]
MSTIVFFAPAGGAGRTTAVMTLASAIAEKQRYRTLVIDASYEAQLAHREDTTLSRWYERMLGCGVSTDVIDFERARNTDDLSRILRSEHERRLLRGFPILIDTSARVDDLALSAAHNADFIIAPFTDALTAYRVSEALREINLSDTRVYGLRCGIACDPSQHQAVTAAFTAGRLFQHGIPTSEIVSNISEGGHMAAMRLEHSLMYADYPLDTVARAPIHQAQRAASEIGKLVEEVLFALQGLELHPRSEKRQTTPLPLHKLAELLPT